MNICVHVKVQEEVTITINHSVCLHIKVFPLSYSNSDSRAGDISCSLLATVRLLLLLFTNSSRVDWGIVSIVMISGIYRHNVRLTYLLEKTL